MNSATGILERCEDNPATLAQLSQRLVALPQFDLVTPASSQRDAVEAYIQSKFNAAYGANPRHFLPYLLTLHCGNQLSGAAGVTLAGNNAQLFLEHYLDNPVDVVLQQLITKPVARQQIAEVGNLVATTRGASRLVFIVLASMLHQAGLDWMVFTATAPLIVNLRKLGFAIETVAPAELSRLPAELNRDWGTYYSHAPQVVAGNLDAAMNLIAGRTMYSALQHLFQEQIATHADALTGVRR